MRFPQVPVLSTNEEFGSEVDSGGGLDYVGGLTPPPFSSLEESGISLRNDSFKHLTAPLLFCEEQEAFSGVFIRKQLPSLPPKDLLDVPEDNKKRQSRDSGLGYSDNDQDSSVKDTVLERILSTVSRKSYNLNVGTGKEEKDPEVCLRKVSKLSQDDTYGKELRGSNLGQSSSTYCKLSRTSSCASLSSLSTSSFPGNITPSSSVESISVYEHKLSQYYKL